VRAIILAAGRGSRLGETGRPHPKCLTWLGGRRLLDFQRDALSRNGLHEKILLTGFAAKRLRLMAGETRIHNLDWARSGPVGSLSCVPRNILREGFLLVYADCVFHPDHVRALLASSAPLAMTYDCDWYALWSLRMRDVLGDAERFRLDGEHVNLIGGRAQTLGEIQGQFTGLVKVTAAAWPAIENVLDHASAEAIAKWDTTTMLARLIAQGQEIRGVPIHGRWLELDSRQDLAHYRQRLRQSQRWSHDWRIDTPA
jgi:L-glutamine-phosphate cytidylyltransferase